MSFPDHIWKQLKNLTANDLIRALTSEGATCDANPGAERVYRLPNGRRCSIHSHPHKTFGPKLLQALLDDIGWTEADLRRLKLVK